MLPVLFGVGNLSVSSFGTFIVLGFLYGVFLIWRLIRAWDLDEEKALDLLLLTFIGGLVGARLYFVIEHLPLFNSSFLNLFFINKVPGFNFWGGLLGGWLSLYFFTRRLRLDFWQLADISSVGLLGGLILADLGCFLGGCNVGAVSRTFLAVSMEGLIGKRWPVQIVEAILFAFALSKVWFQATHFHQRGKIAGITFIFLGIIGLILNPFKNDHSELIFFLALTLLGLTVFYRVTKQNPLTQLKNLASFIRGFFTDPGVRKKTVQFLSKSWYNQTTAISWKIRNLNKLLRRSNAKLS